MKTRISWKQEDDPPACFRRSHGSRRHWHGPARMPLGQNPNVNSQMPKLLKLVSEESKAEREEVEHEAEGRKKIIREETTSSLVVRKR
uniref:Uncharacterized protein n=1 Tax=Vespula pensylvanica TaxID=30213 RepID=A0A834P8K1_VESPE|nr:hypothetical protein H0235_004544 [Vespula pensylvanica]